MCVCVCVCVMLNLKYEICKVFLLLIPLYYVQRIRYK